MQTGKCGTCGYCQPAPAAYNQPPHPQLGKAYGWCHAPLPAHVRPTIPLIYHQEMRGKTCAVWIPVT